MHENVLTADSRNRRLRLSDKVRIREFEEGIIFEKAPAVTVFDVNILIWHF